MFRDEVLGYDRLREMARALYGLGEDPAAVTRVATPFSFVRAGDHYEVQLDLPFAEKGEINLFRKEDELVIEVGTIRRHVGLPTTMTALTPAKARLDGRKLIIEGPQATASKARASEHIDNICDALGKGVEALADAVTPPESACKHFREARIEVLRGIRAIIDHRIEHLSRGQSRGTRVVVE
jgi:hypothetical protein